MSLCYGKIISDINFRINVQQYSSHRALQQYQLIEQTALSIFKVVMRPFSLYYVRSSPNFNGFVVLVCNPCVAHVLYFLLYLNSFPFFLHSFSLSPHRRRKRHLPHNIHTHKYIYMYKT